MNNGENVGSPIAPDRRMLEVAGQIDRDRFIRDTRWSRTDRAEQRAADSADAGVAPCLSTSNAAPDRCPNNSGGFCSREGCNFILNGGCAWASEHIVVTTDEYTEFSHCHGCLWMECVRRGVCLRNRTATSTHCPNKEKS